MWLYWCHAHMDQRIFISEVINIFGVFILDSSRFYFHVLGLGQVQMSAVRSTGKKRTIHIHHPIQRKPTYRNNIG